MPTLFQGELHVHYSQFYVESEADLFGNVGEACGGQVNGLCGAAEPGQLFLTTGLHTGNIELTIELLDARPPEGDEWEEIVEVSFRPTSDNVILAQWAAEKTWPLALERIDYRVRYCASGMDEARRQDTRMGGEPPADRYLLQLWPQPPAPDAVIRQTSNAAAYWHNHAASTPPPPTPEQRAEAERRERLARERAHAETALRAERQRWGGRLPSEGARRANGARIVAAMDRQLFDAIDALDAGAQRMIGAWAARRAYTVAGLADLGWVAPALAVVERGEPLPPPFDEGSDPFEMLDSDPGVPSTTTSYDGCRYLVSQQHMALPALPAAAQPDPVEAALEALFHAIATYGDEYPLLLAEIRLEFPTLCPPDGAR